MVRLPFLLAVLLSGIPVESAAQRAEIKGYIKLAPSFAPLPVFDAPGHWVLPNEHLEIQPPSSDARMEMVVELRGGRLTPKALVTPELRIEDARIIPTVLPVHVATKITFRNEDSAPHILETEGSPSLAPRRIGIGESFAHAFAKAGAYRVHCTEVPHLVAEVLVSDAPLLTLPDTAGVFTFPDVPTGTYTLRIWYRGRWIHDQAVLAKGKTRVDIELTKPTGKD